MADVLRQIASTGNGVYLQASDYEGPGLSEELYTRISEGNLSEGQQEQAVASRVMISSEAIDIQWLPLFISIILLIVGLGLPEVEEEHL